MGYIAATAAGVDEALQMYLRGYTFDEIYDQIGVNKSRYSPLITADDRLAHRKAYLIRKQQADFRYKWEDARNALINSGRDLSRITIVPER